MSSTLSLSDFVLKKNKLDSFFLENWVDSHVVRLAITGVADNGDQYIVEGSSLNFWQDISMSNCWDFIPRKLKRDNSFVVALLIPTGMGCHIGGHAGDAGPVAKLLGTCCDCLILHPNVVNASDVNEMPENALYVEGSVFSRLFMGNVSVVPVRSNRILVLIDNHDDKDIINWSINAVNAAVATCGLDAIIKVLPEHLDMRITRTPSGRASGEVKNFDILFNAVDVAHDDFDAIAIASPLFIDNWKSVVSDYFCGKNGINPWGGAEAALSHAISMIFNLPVAHVPMSVSKEMANSEVGIVDPRMAAECVSLTYFNCALKGLMRAPRIGLPGEGLSVEDIDALVAPIKCLGIPTLAAMRQKIPIILVRENDNISPDYFDRYLNGYVVENYLEVAGLLQTMRLGMKPGSVRRPLKNTVVLE